MIICNSLLLLVILINLIVSNNGFILNNRLINRYTVNNIHTYTAIKQKQSRELSRLFGRPRKITNESDGNSDPKPKKTPKAKSSKTNDENDVDKPKTKKTTSEDTELNSIDKNIIKKSTVKKSKSNSLDSLSGTISDSMDPFIGDWDEEALNKLLDDSDFVLPELSLDEEAMAAEAALKSLAAGDNSEPLLGDFELDDALRSIESGNFELEDFLVDEDEELFLNFESETKDSNIKPNKIDVQNNNKKNSLKNLNLALSEDDDEDDAQLDSLDDEDDDLNVEDELDDIYSTPISSLDDDDIVLDVIAEDTDFDFNDDIEDDIEENKIKSIDESEDKIVKPIELTPVDTTPSKPKRGRKKASEKLLKDSTVDLINKAQLSGDLDINNNIKSKDQAPLVIDGIQIDRQELGVNPPPLEEFKRLMESLGPETMFEEDLFFGEGENEPEDEAIEEEREEEEEEKELLPEEKIWYPVLYEGGDPNRAGYEYDTNGKVSDWINIHDRPTPWRLQIVSVVTNSSTNSSALDIVNQVYDYIKIGTNNDSRINYQVICLENDDGEPYEELDNMIQMWSEGYNTYHLVDGHAMKEAWGCIMPHIMLSEKNLEAIVAQVRWALNEDTMDGALLTPRLRGVRFRGGAKEMAFGFNTDRLDSEFSVVSVR